MGLVDELRGLKIELRARYSTIKTPDAIQVSVGVLYGASKFLTNDPDLKRVDGIEVLVLDDFLQKEKDIK